VDDTMRVYAQAAITLLSLRPRMPSPRTAQFVAVDATDTDADFVPLYNFDGPGASTALDAWERIDDVIMGGVSSSRLVAAADGGALFEGRLRSEGGGFCGQRMRLLAEPLDLSASEGLFIDCEVLPVGAAPSARVWKMAVRTKQDRGEVVYQKAFSPPTGRQRVKLPFEDFRLVRGPRVRCRRSIPRRLRGLLAGCSALAGTPLTQRYDGSSLASTARAQRPAAQSAAGQPDLPSLSRRLQIRRLVTLTLTLTSPSP
jgi:hypothetical protein